jgi:hypothetical protein
MDDIVAPPTATQDAIPALADDLLKDRIRQFLEFLDDEVSSPSHRMKIRIAEPLASLSSHLDMIIITVIR